MRLALSVRIAEAPRSKTRIALPFDRLAQLAAEAGFEGLSLRPSVLDIDATADRGDEIRASLRAHDLACAMVTGALSIATNDGAATRALANIAPHLDLAEALGATRVRVMAHGDEDLAPARAAAAAARTRSLTLCHQIHWGSLCETVDQALATVAAVGSPGFRLTYEPANLLATSGDAGIDALPRLLPHLANVYYQNLALDPASTTVFQTRTRGAVGVRFLPLGDSAGIDPAPMVARLRDIGYRGWLTVHQPLLAGERVEDVIAEAGRRFRALLS